MDEPESVATLDLELILTSPYGDEARAAFLERLTGPFELGAFMDFVVRELLARDHGGIFWGDRMLTLDKAAGFLDDPRFEAAWAQVRGAHQYDQYDNRQSIAWRLHTLVWAARQALQLPAGVFVECGVFQGDMSFVVYHAAGLAGAGRPLRLFDSFSGIDPERVLPGEYGASTGYLDMANHFYGRPTLFEEVQARFAACPEVSLHRGMLPETLDEAPVEPIGWLHIDLNAAGPERAVLERLFDRVVPGGYIILDDYGWRPFFMQKQLEDAFFAERGHAVLELPTGQGLVVKHP